MKLFLKNFIFYLRAVSLFFAMSCFVDFCVKADETSKAPSKNSRDKSESASLWTRPGEDWSTFLGPSGNGRSQLVGLQAPWPKQGPPLVWQIDLAEGYCAPAAALGRILVYDRIKNTLRLRCLNAETGEALWEQLTTTDYVDSFGYDGGPRAGPVIAGTHVITFSPDGILQSISLADGSVEWTVNTSRDYHVIQNFFGVGAAPIVLDDLVIVQVGGSRPRQQLPSPQRLDLVRGLDSGVVAFDLHTGIERWRCADTCASYSTPVISPISGQLRLFAWTRDRLLSIEPHSGKLQCEFPFRADELFSVNAASPVSIDSRVLLSETYGPGSILLEMANDMPLEIRRDTTARRGDSLKCHWATPIFYKGHLYGSSGRNSGDADFVCVEMDSGKFVWRTPGLGRASMVLADGHLIVLGEFGELLLVEATEKSYREVSRVEFLEKGTDRTLLEPPCWAAPIIAHGYLYVRGKGKLLCLDLIAAASQRLPQ